MLPQGLILGSEGIAGTPVNAGSSTLNVLVTDSHGFTTTANHRITISLPGLGFETSSLPDAQVGALYTSALTALSANPPAQWSAISGLPEGLALNSSGQLAGTPNPHVSQSFRAGVKRRAGSGFPQAVVGCRFWNGDNWSRVGY
jgi:large repetitive protein